MTKLKSKSEIEGQLTIDDVKLIIKNASKGVEWFKFNICTGMTLNNLRRLHFQEVAKLKKDNTLLAQLDCQNKKVFNGEVWVELFYFLKNNIDPMDNLPSAVKPIFDGMKAAGIIVDDSIKIIQSPAISWFVKYKPANKKSSNFVIILMAEFPIFRGKKIDLT